MKKTKFKEEISSLDVAALGEKLDSLRRELFSVRLNASTAHVKDYSQYNKLRKDIARVLTLKRQQREVEQQ